MFENKFNQISKRDVCDRCAQPCRNGDCGYRCPTVSSPSTALPNVLLPAGLKVNDEEYARCVCDIQARGHELNKTLALIRLPDYGKFIHEWNVCLWYWKAAILPEVCHWLFSSPFSCVPRFNCKRSCLLEEPPHLPLTAISVGLQSTSVIPAADIMDKPVWSRSQELSGKSLQSRRHDEEALGEQIKAGPLEPLVFLGSAPPPNKLYLEGFRVT